MSKSAPKPPDYTGAAEAQARSSREVTEQQTWANRPDINTPFGNQTWEQQRVWDPATQQYLNKWTQNTELTPETQAALDSQMNVQMGRSQLAESMLGRAQDEYGNPMDWSQFTELAGTPQGPQYGQGLSPYGTTPQANQYSPEAVQRQLSTEGLQSVDPSQRYYDNAGDAIYNQFSSRAEPQFERDTERLRTQLYNQGLREGDEAYDRELEKLRQSQGDARQQASYQATIGAGQEAARMHGMDTTTRGQQFGERESSGAFANQAANQALMQQLGIGGQQFQEQMAQGGMDDSRRNQQANEQLAFGQNQFANNMQSANYQNQLRQQQIAEQMQKRGFSLNEINAILTGQQVGMPQMPGFSQAGAAQATQYLPAAGMQHQANMDQFNAQQAGFNNLMGGITGLAGAIKPFGF